MRLGIRGKLFLASVVVVLIGVVLAGFYFDGQVREFARKRAETELSHQLQIVRDIVVHHPSLADTDADALARKVSKLGEVRVTLIDHAGRVLGDSGVAAQAVAAMELHDTRPEVLAAHEHGYGAALRHSATLDKTMLYVAVPYTHKQGAGIVRLSRPLHSLDEALRQLRRGLIFACLLGLIGATILSAVASHVLSRALRSLVRDASSLAERALEPARLTSGVPGKLDVDGTDELGELAVSLNRMADKLASTVSELSDERSRITVVLDSMSDAVVAIDRDFHIVMGNRAAEQMFAVDLTDSQIGLEQLRVPALHDLAARVLEGESDEIECETLRPSKRVLQAHGRPLHNADGAVLVMRDVTELRRLESMRRDFVANISHELRTPVGIIRANSEALLDGAMQQPELATRFLQAQIRNADRLKALVDDLLEIARIESGAYKFDLQPTTVAPRVRRVLEGIYAIADEKNITLSSEVDDDIRVVADTRGLDHVLLNLVENAVKYTQDGGDVVVHAINIEQRIRISVIDNGPGIEPHHRERVFERFYRVDPGRARGVGGTGLGLAIVRHLAEAMGGRVGVDPAGSRGSAFWIELDAPRQTADPTA